MDETPRVDLVTVIGLALITMPTLTMIHELGGHAAACAATGGTAREIGAFYVDCDAPSALSGRLVAAAGPAIDMVLAFVAWLLRPRLKTDLARLTGWYLWLCFAFSAAGYFLFSGVAGIGDLNPGEGSGIGPLPYPALWRVLFAFGGGLVYFLLVRAGMRGLTELIGQGLATRRTRRVVAHGFYVTLSIAAVIASLPNPVGLFITLASATAASFGGKAGMISIGFATHADGTPRAFVVRRCWGLLVVGVVATTLFAAILGPSLRTGEGNVTIVGS